MAKKEKDLLPKKCNTTLILTNCNWVGQWVGAVTNVVNPCSNREGDISEKDMLEYIPLLGLGACSSEEKRCN